MAHASGISEIFLVRGDQPADPGIPCIGVVDNPNPSNMVDSLFRAEPHFGADFIMSYGDIIYEPQILRQLCSAKEEVTVVIDCDWVEYFTLRNPDVRLDSESLVMEDGWVKELGMPVAPEAPLPIGRYVGLVRFKGAGVQALRNTYHDLREKYAGRPWRNAPLFELAFMTDLIQELIDRGIPVRAQIIRRGWIELDTRADYEWVLAAEATGSISEVINIDSLPTRPTVLSAGGLVWRIGSQGLEVLIVTQRHEGWRLPKGMQERGESLLMTAAREIAEETGLLCIAREYLGCSSWTYSFGGRDWDEICRFYIMEPTELTCEISDPQIDGTRWVAAASALQMLKFAGEQAIVREFSELFRKSSREKPL
jgi:choline kinase/8-oxo-dGTP pyrophosphatase MutT (NUDIX family)